MNPSDAKAAPVGTTTTESVEPRYANLDLLSTEDLVRTMNEADMQVPLAVSSQVPMIARAVNAIAAGMENGGRLFYVGAGTSGRLGVLDASECPPTFSSDPSQVVGIIAGGDYALRHAAEGAEDDYLDGYETLKGFDLNSRDSVVGIAASGRTPFVLGALAAASEAGATTIGLSNNPDSAISAEVSYPIEVVVGPEVLSGSTRLKSGTAQKMVLNMISTATMVRLGKTYGNLMVDVSATNEKLEERARNLVVRITGCNREEAQRALDASGGSVKVASVCLLLEIEPDEARAVLQTAGGSMRRALKDQQSA